VLVIPAEGVLATVPAQAREPVTITPVILPAGVICPFAVAVGVYSNNEHNH
jgi:hypothetical protein